MQELNLTFKYRFLYPLLAKLPAKVAYRLASLIGYREMSNKSDLAEQIHHQMHKALVDVEPDIRHWVKYYFGLVEREILDTWTYPSLNNIDSVNRLIKVKNIQPLMKAQSEGQPVIITSGHYSRFWMVGIAMAAYGIPLATLARDRMDENTSGLSAPEFEYRKLKLSRLHRLYGGQFISTDKGMRQLFKELKHNPVAILMDVPTAESAGSRVEVEFFNHQAYVADGIAKIAKKTDALIQPYFIEEDRNGLTLEFLPMLKPADDDSETMQHLLSLLQHRIQQRPGQWHMWQALPIFWNEV